MSPGPTFDRVYLALKEQIVGGWFAPGDHLEPAALGEELNASITPVRDALHRLVGERIVEAPGHNGFRLPMPTEAELRDLYGWNQALLELALGRMRRNVSIDSTRPARNAPEDTAVIDGAAGLFRAIAGRSGSTELRLALEGLNDRLGPMRAAEAKLLDDLEGELALLSAAFVEGQMSALRRGLVAYHRRRQRRVPDLLTAARLHPGRAATLSF